MSSISVTLIGIATILNSINIIRVIKRLKDVESVIERIYMKGADDE